MSALRLDLIVRRYPQVPGLGSFGLLVDRWTWRLRSGSRIVSTSGSQQRWAKNDFMQALRRYLRQQQETLREHESVCSFAEVS